LTGVYLQFYSAAPNIEHGVSRLSLGEYCLIFSVFNLFTGDLAHEGLNLGPPVCSRHFIINKLTTAMGVRTDMIKDKKYTRVEEPESGSRIFLMDFAGKQRI
jgi:hypothetical protein